MEGSRVEELAREYLETLACRGLARSTQAAYQHGLRRFLWFLRGKDRRRATAIRPEDLAGFRRWVLEEMARSPKARGTPRGLSTVDAWTRTARRFCQWLVKAGQLLVDPSIHLEPVRLRRKIPRVLTQEEMGRLIGGLESTDPVTVRDRAVVEVLYSTGLRCGELVRLDLGDLDLAGGELLVRRGKGGASRRAPLGECARDAVQQYLDEARDDLIDGGERAGFRTDPVAVFLNQHGTRYSRLLVGRMIGARAREARVEGAVTPHTLRHTAAVHLLQGGANIREVQEFLGHRNLDTTAHYTRLLIEDLKESHLRAHPRSGMGE